MKFDIEIYTTTQQFEFVILIEIKYSDQVE